MLEKIRDTELDILFKAIVSLENIDECYAFFDDLCTVSEVKSMSQRFQVARMLMDDEHYNSIVEKTGASTATISRVKRSLDYGCDGYSTVLPRIKSE